MASHQPLLIWGASGHASVVVDLAGRLDVWDVVGLLDDVHPQGHGEDRFGTRVLGSSSLLPDLVNGGVRHLIVAIGSNTKRRECSRVAESAGFTFPVLVHPAATIGSRVEIGAGTVVLAQSVVNPDAVIGRHGIINTGSIIEHGCRLGDGVHVSPRAVLAGEVRVGDEAWIGVGAVVKDHICIGRGAVVGAGAVVIDDVPDGAVVAGVPARSLRSAES